MRLSGLSLATILLFSSVMLAQHSSGGGGGSSGGGGGGGGSHGGSVSSGGSGGGHSSGGSSSHSSGGGHSSGGHGSGSISSRSGGHGSQTHGPHSVLGSHRGVNTKNAQSEKRSFFSFLRHPFRKPEPAVKPVADLRRPICVHGRCPVCLPGHGCGVVAIRWRRNSCSARDLWSGSGCLLQTSFFDDCSGLRRMMEQQAQRMQAAEAEQQSACSTAAGQACSDLTTAVQSEGNLYRTLQDRYRMCRQRSLGAFPFAAFGFSPYSAGLLFGSLDMELDF
jgi:hypothetical protein